MKTSMSPELLAHYASSSTTIITCWKVTRRDGKVFGYTALDRDLVVAGQRYSALVGIGATAIASSADLSIQNLSVTGLLQEGLVGLGALTQADILAGIWDDARVTIFEVNYEDTTMGIGTLQTGTLGQIEAGRLTYTAELRGLMQSLNQTIGKTVQPGCFKDVGDADCGVNLALYTYNGVVSTVLSTREWIDTALGQPDHQCQYGKVTWLTGLNAGLAMEVKDQSSQGDVILQSDMPYAIAVGDTYHVSAGCNKLLKNAETVYAAAIASAVTGTSSGSGFSDSARGEADHTWDAARVTWTSGENLGIITEVESFVSHVFTLLGSMPFAIADGDTYTLEQLVATGALVYSGDCKTKFTLENAGGNVLNFGGFAEVPGNDKVLGAGNTA